MRKSDAISDRSGKIYRCLEERTADGLSHEDLADLYETLFDDLSDLLEEAIAVIKSMEEGER